IVTVVYSCLCSCYVSRSSYQLIFVICLFSHCSDNNPGPPSFPTRRSSDLHQISVSADDRLERIEDDQARMSSGADGHRLDPLGQSLRLGTKIARGVVRVRMELAVGVTGEVRELAVGMRDRKSVV